MPYDLTDLLTSNISFIVVPESDLPRIRREGLDLDGALRFTLLDQAIDATGPSELVLAAAAHIDEGGWASQDRFHNLTPYRHPRRIDAGGGLVLKDDGNGPEVLLIFRRGVWDLPKGKPDPGEPIEMCALREVREEVGVDVLHCAGPAGVTVHGYPETEHFIVKRTTWFFLTTPERSFIPQLEEDIERVEWAPWSAAVVQLGYPNLQKHLQRLGVDAAREALQRVDT